MDTTQNLSETPELLCGSRGHPRALPPLVMDNRVPLVLAEAILSPPAGSYMKQHGPTEPTPRLSFWQVVQSGVLNFSYP